MTARARTANTASAASDLKLTDARWRAIIGHDAAADGRFVYAVATTGIYCRPSCRSRAPRRENVRVFLDRDAAHAAGFRACRRCRPDADAPLAADAAIIAACRILEAADPAPPLAELAKAVGLSPFHLQRRFKARVGFSPKGYADALRAGRVRVALPDAASVTEALYAAGYNSAAPFYAAAKSALGMTPQTFRNGGAGETLSYAIGRSTLGLVLVAASGAGVCAIFLGDDADALASDLARAFPKAELKRGDAPFKAIVSAVIAQIDEPARAHASLPLDIRGTAFQQRVWRALQAIPPGETASYAQIAARIGAPTSSRAVARACATNTLAVVVPCHRVVRGDGALSGYRWGVARKRALLDRERGE